MYQAELYQHTRMTGSPVYTSLFHQLPEHFGLNSQGSQVLSKGLATKPQPTAPSPLPTRDFLSYMLVGGKHEKNDLSTSHETHITASTGEVHKFIYVHGITLPRRPQAGQTWKPVNCTWHGCRSFTDSPQVSEDGHLLASPSISIYTSLLQPPTLQSWDPGPHPSSSTLGLATLRKT